VGQHLDEILHVAASCVLFPVERPRDQMALKGKVDFGAIKAKNLAHFRLLNMAVFFLFKNLNSNF
jgi:hypothetical protein